MRKLNRERPLRKTKEYKKGRGDRRGQKRGAQAKNTSGTVTKGRPVYIVEPKDA